MRTSCLVLLSVGALGASLRCANGTPPPDEPLVAPPPRCVELETKMVECARTAAGVSALPPSVETGLREAAGLNCRRLRSASRDHDLPARIAAACSPESCAAFAACVAREAEAAGVFLAARDAPPEQPATQPPEPPGERPGEGAEAEVAGDPLQAAACEPFVDKMTACTEEALGGPLEPDVAGAAAIGYENACVQLGLSTDVLNDALNACAPVPCGDYPGCVADYLGFGGGP